MRLMSSQPIDPDPDLNVSITKQSTSFSKRSQAIQGWTGNIVIIPYVSGGEDDTEFYLRVFAESQPLLEFL